MNLYFLSDLANFAKKEKIEKTTRIKRKRRKDGLTAADRDRMDPFKNTRRAISSGATISREVRSWLRLPGQIRSSFLTGNKKK